MSRPRRTASILTICMSDSALSARHTRLTKPRSRHLRFSSIRSPFTPTNKAVDEGGGRGPALYRYEPRTGAFLSERWPRLRELPACAQACHELGAGASAWLRVNGLRGEQAEPALQAMLERLYEDATSFGFPEERFERVYGEVEVTLYRDAVRARVVAPLRGAWMEIDRLELGDGLSIVRGDAFDTVPHERLRAALCVLERDAPADEPISDRGGRRRASPLWSPRCGCGRPAA